MNASYNKFSFSDWENLAGSNPFEFISSYEEFRSHHKSSALVKQLSLLYASTLFNKSRVDAAKSQCLENIQDAISPKDYPRLIQNYLLLAKCYANMGEAIRIKACFDLALDFAKASRDPHLLTLVYLDYAAYLATLKAYNPAQEYLESAWKVIHKSTHTRQKVDVLMGFGDIAYNQQNYPNALSYITRAYEQCLCLNDIGLQIQLMDKLATLYDMSSDHDTATEILQKALSLCKDIPPLRFKIIYNNGTHLLRIGNAAQALPCFEEAKKLAQAIGFTIPRFFCELYSNIAGCYWKMQDIAQAKANMEIAIKYVNQIENRDLLAQTRLNQTHILILLGECAQAKQMIQETLDYYLNSQNHQGSIMAYNAMIALCEHCGDLASALAFTKKLEHSYQNIIAKLQSDFNSDCTAVLGSLNKQADSGLLGFSLRSSTKHGSDNFGFIGSSPASRKVLESALLAAQHPNTNVFIFGESGTGKDVLANIIHHNSIRRDSPFVPINISAFSSGVLESELFGHVRGAFTGAINSTKGFLSKANKGTLFLDEITEMPSEFQSKLLRVVENHKFSPVGSTEELCFEGRIISSTNRDIYDAINANLFRLDLFHRLNTIEIYIPPLRDRKDDIEEILFYYADAYAQQNKLKSPKISSDFVYALKRYSFPGNVRELKNLIERLYILSGNQAWTEANLIGLKIVDKTRIEDSKSWHDPEIEKIIHALEQCKGKQKEAAKLLKLSESTLCRRIAKYNLEAYTQRHRTL